MPLDAVLHPVARSAQDATENQQVASSLSSTFAYYAGLKNCRQFLGRGLPLANRESSDKNEPTKENTMKRRTIHCLLAVLTLSLMLVGSATAGEDRIARSRSAAPASISDDATVMEGDGTILHEGSNGWTCMPDTMPNHGAPMCNDAMWTETWQPPFGSGSPICSLGCG